MGTLNDILLDHVHGFKWAKAEDMLTVKGEPGRLVYVVEKVREAVWEQWLLPICCPGTLNALKIDKGQPWHDALSLLKGFCERRAWVFLHWDNLFERLGITRDEVVKNPSNLPIKHRSEATLLSLLWLTYHYDIGSTSPEPECLDCVITMLKEMQLTRKHINIYFPRLIAHLCYHDNAFRDEIIFPIMKDDAWATMNTAIFLTLEVSQMEELLHLNAQPYHWRVSQWVPENSPLWSRTFHDVTLDRSDIWATKEWMYRYSLYAQSSVEASQKVYTLRKAARENTKNKNMGYYHLVDLTRTIPDTVFEYLEGINLSEQMLFYSGEYNYNSEEKYYLLVWEILQHTKKPATINAIINRLTECVEKKGNLNKIWWGMWRILVQIWQTDRVKSLLETWLKNSPGESPDLCSVSVQWYNDTFPDLEFNFPVQKRHEVVDTVEAL